MKPYDPLDYGNLARSVVNALLEGPQHSLPPQESFEGSGVYAIYYHGDFAGYARLVESATPTPIYVGKAVPTGARKGGRKATVGRELHQRLAQHGKSIEQTENLQPADFTCRYGFGNHDPGAGRRAMKRPLWDIVHPGRPWAARLNAEMSYQEVFDKLTAFLRGQV